MHQLEEVFGFEVTWLDVDERGVVRLDQLKQALSEKTALVSIMAVNNEVGSVMPLEEIKQIVKKQSCTAAYRLRSGVEAHRSRSQSG